MTEDIPVVQQGLQQGARRGVTEGREGRAGKWEPGQSKSVPRGGAARGLWMLDVTEASEAKKRHGQAHTLGPEAHS